MKAQILVPLETYPEGYTNPAASYVAAVGRHLDGELHALVHVVDFPEISSLLGDVVIDVSSMVAEAEANARARGASLLRALRAEAQSAQVPLRESEAKCVPAAFGDVVADHARYHDLVVAGFGRAEPAQAVATEVIVFGSGRPTLLVPEQLSASSFGHVMIAWDGSRVAARATADARDFLDRAKAVTVCTVLDEKPISGETLADRLAASLSRRYAAPVSVNKVKTGSRPIAETLQEHAREIGADLIVMGAFGHSRLRDFVLGGATRDVLKDLRLPVLFSH